MNTRLALLVLAVFLSAGCSDEPREDDRAEYGERWASIKVSQGRHLALKGAKLVACKSGSEIAARTYGEQVGKYNDSIKQKATEIQKTRKLTRETREKLLRDLPEKHEPCPR